MSPWFAVAQTPRRRLDQIQAVIPQEPQPVTAAMAGCLALFRGAVVLMIGIMRLRPKPLLTARTLDWTAFHGGTLLLVLGKGRSVTGKATAWEP